MVIVGLLPGIMYGRFFRSVFVDITKQIRRSCWVRKSVEVEGGGGRFLDCQSRSDGSISWHEVVVHNPSVPIDDVSLAPEVGHPDPIDNGHPCGRGTCCSPVVAGLSRVGFVLLRHSQASRQNLHWRWQAEAATSFLTERVSSDEVGGFDLRGANDCEGGEEEGDRWGKHHGWSVDAMYGSGLLAEHLITNKYR